MLSKQIGQKFIKIIDHSTIFVRTCQICEHMSKRCPTFGQLRVNFYEFGNCFILVKVSYPFSQPLRIPRAE